MKRIDLIRHVEAHGYRLLREGSNHSVYFNESKRRVSTIPRHREIDEFLARKICRDLEISASVMPDIKLSEVGLARAFSEIFSQRKQGFLV